MKPGALLAAAVGLVVLTGCGESGLEAPEVLRAEVTFVYQASTERNFDIPDCGVGETHIHPSWQDYKVVPFTAFGPMEWRRKITGVPVGVRHKIRVSDANWCDRDPYGATTENIFANGVHLTRLEMTPGNGLEPGLSFEVEADGTVKP